MKKIDYANMPLDDLIALKQRCAKVAEMVRDDVAKIVAANARIVEGKNAADAAATEKTGLWADVFAVTRKIADATEDTPDFRYEAFTEALAAVLIPPTTESGEKVKPTTAGAYASTARNLLLKATEGRLKLEEAEGKTYAEIRAMLKPPAHPEREAKATEARKALRVLAKDATASEWQDVEKALAAIASLAVGVTDRKEKAKKAGKKAVTEQPKMIAGSTVETVAANIADGGNDEKPAAIVAAG